MKNIAVLAGGYSSEREISLNSGKQVLNNLDKNLYNSFLVEVNTDGLFCIYQNQKFRVDLNSFSCQINNNIIKFDFAYIVIHGQPGEDGKIQGYLDLLNIPYSSCSVYASAITFNKLACKNLLANTGVYLAKSTVINNGHAFSIDEIINQIGLPCFIKPNTAGSSFGVTKVYEKENFINAVNVAAQEDDTIIVEEFIKGTEVSCGIIKTNNKNIVLPVTEISTTNDFFDTEAKYKPELTQEITPARISDEETKLVQDFTSFIYDKLELSGIVRIDYIIKDGKPYFLEVNSIPGMSAESIIPKQIRTINKTIQEFLTLVIEDKF